MLLRDFKYLDWENVYYVIHAGDHIRYRRVLIEETKKELEAICRYKLEKRHHEIFPKREFVFIGRTQETA